MNSSWVTAWRPWREPIGFEALITSWYLSGEIPIRCIISSTVGILWSLNWSSCFALWISPLTYIRKRVSLWFIVTILFYRSIFNVSANWSSHGSTCRETYRFKSKGDLHEAWQSHRTNNGMPDPEEAICREPELSSWFKAINSRYETLHPSLTEILESGAISEVLKIFIHDK